MPDTRSNGNVLDTMALPGYEVPDAAPASVAAENQKAQPAYIIPPAVWMIVFLIGGYMGLRWILED